MTAADLPAWLPFWWLNSIWWSFGLFFLVALTEMVFPPFPGDTVFFVALVGVQAGGMSTVLPLVATLFGALAGFGVLYWLGRSRGRRLFRAERTGLLALSSLEKVEGWFTRWGGLVVLFGRFVTGVRSAIPVAAGVSNYPVLKTLTLGALSIVLWNGLLAIAALVLHKNWGTVSGYWQKYSLAFWLVAMTALILFFARKLWARRSAQ
jgi:membrane protein DedA with SNARE-associated domain